MKKRAFFLVLLTVCLLLLTGACFASAEETGPAILEQPKSVTVNYPEGATFTVVPENPEQVVSYQWYYVDSARQVFQLDGTSAATDTLVCPAFSKYYDETCFFCVLTDADGNTTESAPAWVTVENYFEQKKLLFISGYCIRPGETLDLSETELGEGTISYSADSTAITFRNVFFDNTSVIMDHILNEVAVTLYDDMTEISRLNVILEGENTLKNTFYQPSSNGSGITLDLYFSGESMESVPSVRVSGEGSLTLIGGTIQLRTNGDLYLDAPLSFRRNGDYFCDAVNGANVTVCENTPLSFDVNGTLIYAKRDITVLDGATIAAKTSAPYVSGDYTNKNGFLCGGDLTVRNAAVKMELTGDPDRFIREGLGIINFLGVNSYGNVTVTGSRVEIAETAKPCEQPYFFYGGGISCNDLTVSDSELSVKIDADDILKANGIFADGDITVTGSKVDCYTHTSGSVFGIAANGLLTVKDSTVTADTAGDGGDAYGVMCGSAELSFSADGQKLESTVSGGVALGAKIGTGEEALSFDPDYTPALITLGENTVFFTPEDGSLNQSSMVSYADEFGTLYIHIETPYSLSDTSKPAAHAVIAYHSDEPTPGGEDDDDGPETADENRTGLWLTAAALSAVVTAGAILTKRELGEAE